MSRKFKIIAVLAALVPAAFAAWMVVLWGNDGRPTVKPVDVDPALWVVRDSDTTIYLFGAVHVLKPGLSWFDEAVRDAFDRSDTLVLELADLDTPEGQQAISDLVEELGGLPSGTTLQDTLPPADWTKLDAVLTRENIPNRTVEHYEPWLAAIQLASVPLSRLGYRNDDGVEAVLLRAARASGKQATGLETAREQFGYFDRLSPDAQRAMLQRAIGDLPGTQKRIERLIAAWGKGDADALAAMLNAELKASPELANALLVERNRRWADWIAKRMAQPGTVFVAVGAGHLAGDASVQAELAKRGFKVERVPY